MSRLFSAPLDLLQKSPIYSKSVCSYSPSLAKGGLQGGPKPTFARGLLLAACLLCAAHTATAQTGGADVAGNAAPSRAVPAAPVRALPSAGGAEARRAGLTLTPAVGTSLEYRVSVQAEVLDFRPEAWSLTPQVPDGVVAANLENTGLLGGKFWNDLRASFAAPIPDAKFFVRALPPPEGSAAGTVQLALTYLQPEAPERPGYSVRTLHTLDAAGRPIAGEVRAGTRGEAFLRGLDAGTLWRVALAGAGLEPVGVYGPDAGGVQVVQQSGAAELAQSGLLEDGEGVPEGTPPLVSVVRTRFFPAAGNKATSSGQAQWEAVQQRVTDPWATTLLWTQGSGNPIAAPFELRARSSELRSRYRADGLPVWGEQTTDERILLGLAASESDPFQLVMHVTTRVKVQTTLIRSTP